MCVQMNADREAEIKQSLAVSRGGPVREKTGQKGAEGPEAERSDGTASRKRRRHEQYAFHYSSVPNQSIEFRGTTRQMKEMIFHRQLIEHAQHEKMLLINPSKHRIGQKIMTLTDKQR